MQNSSENKTFRGAGRGRVFYGGVEYTANEFDQKIKEMNLQPETEKRVRYVADLARMSGLDLRFEDQSTLKERWNWRIHGAQNNDGIMINLDSKSSENEPNSRHIVVTMGHEMTHWLMKNNVAAYIETQRPIGATVTIVEFGYEWSKINYGSRKGWYMMTKFLIVG